MTSSLESNSLQLQRIVIGVDFRAPSLAAVRWSADRFGIDAELVLAHSVGDLDAATLTSACHSAGERLRALCDSLSPTRARDVVGRGDPAGMIADLATDIRADLVVVGAHGDVGSSWDRLGSTAERIIARSDVAVMVATEAFRGSPKRLLIPVLGGDVSGSVLAWAHMLEQRFDASIAIAHVDATDDALREPHRESIDARWHGLASGRRPDQVFTDAIHGDAARCIIDEARRFHTDLIVLSHETLAAVRRAPSDHLVHAILEGAPCAVLLLPGDPAVGAERPTLSLTSALAEA